MAFRRGRDGGAHQSGSGRCRHLARKGRRNPFRRHRAEFSADLVPRAGYKLETIKAAPFPRRLSWRQAAAIYAAMSGWRQAFGIIRRFRPHVVVGTGGYVAGPVVLAAVLLRTATLIAQASAWPGGADNCSPLGWTGPPWDMKRAAVCATRGRPGARNPVRSEVLAASRTGADARKFGLRPDRLTVVIMGGSRGAAWINKAVWSARERLRNEARLQVIHQTGAAGFNEVRGRYASIGIHPTEEGTITDGPMRVVPYLYDMPAIWRRPMSSFLERGRCRFAKYGTWAAFHSRALSICGRRSSDIQRSHSRCRWSRLHDQ